MKRKNMRRYRNIKKNSGVKFLCFIGIMLSAVICGYLTARFVVAPLLGYETEVLKLDFPSKMTALMEKKDEKPEDEDTKAETSSQESEKTASYALQFGVFTEKEGAQTLKETLNQDDIKTEIRENDGKYKVLQCGFDTKEDALKALEALKDKKDIDVFITALDTE